MNNLHAAVFLVAILWSSGCSKRVPPQESVDHPVVYINTKKFQLSCGGVPIANGKDTAEYIASSKPQILDLEYSKDATTADLIHALTYFSSFGIGDYDLIDESRRKHSFFLPGIPDAGVLDGIANTGRVKQQFETHALDEILSNTPITIKRFSHIMLPEEPVSLADLARCLQRCTPAGCVVIDGLEDGYLYTGRYEDWMRDNK